jgi:hypothetical protein
VIIFFKPLLLVVAISFGCLFLDLFFDCISIPV